MIFEVYLGFFHHKKIKPPFGVTLLKISLIDVYSQCPIKGFIFIPQDIESLIQT